MICDTKICLKLINNEEINKKNALLCFLIYHCELCLKKLDQVFQVSFSKKKFKMIKLHPKKE